MKKTSKIIEKQIIDQGLTNMVDSKFVPYLEKCEHHGEFQRNKIIDGHERWIAGCPVCIKELQIKAFMGRAMIPERFQLKSLDDFKSNSDHSKKALDICFDYAINFESNFKIGRSMIFSGEPGTGKTHLACGIANYVMSKGRTALFSTVSEMIRTIRKSWKDKSLDESDLIDSFASVDLLILDEVGVQRGSDDEINLIFQVINKRYEKMKPVIVISNLDAAGIEKYLGNRSFDRLRECGGRLIPFEWASYRTEFL